MRLSDHFEDKDLDWRVGQCGIKNDKPWATLLCYVTARAVMDRLDSVMGPENWKDEYEHIFDGAGNVLGVKCTLSIRFKGEWIAKVDGSPETNTEAFKGGFSKALVRASVKWGIGRYLYDLGISFANFTNSRADGKLIKKALIKDKKTGKSLYTQWQVPQLGYKPTTKPPKGPIKGFKDQTCKDVGDDNFVDTRPIKNHADDIVNAQRSVISQNVPNGKMLQEFEKAKAGLKAES